MNLAGHNLHGGSSNLATSPSGYYFVIFKISIWSMLKIYFLLAAEQYTWQYRWSKWKKTKERGVPSPAPEQRGVHRRVPAPAPAPHTGVCSAHTLRPPSAPAAGRPPPWRSWFHPSSFVPDFAFRQQQFCFLPVPFQVLENNTFLKIHHLSIQNCISMKKLSQTIYFSKSEFIAFPLILN